MASDYTSGEDPVTSKIFNSTFGDFKLLSKDGILFCFPRIILQYSSTVFAGMFEKGTPSAEDKPILVEADGATLELLLTFLHPALSNPSVLNVDSLANLFRLATQYDMQPTIALLRSCFTQPLGDQQDDTLIRREPLASLVTARSFNCPDAARSALIEVIQCDLDAQMRAASKYDIPISLMRQVYQKRAGLSVWLLTMVHVTGLVMMSVKPIPAENFNKPAELQAVVSSAILIRPSFDRLQAWHKSLVEEGYLDQARSEGLLGPWEGQYAAQIAETIGSLQQQEQVQQQQQQQEQADEDEEEEDGEGEEDEEEDEEDESRLIAPL